MLEVKPNLGRAQEGTFVNIPKVAMILFHSPPYLHKEVQIEANSTLGLMLKQAKTPFITELQSPLWQSAISISISVTL